MHCAKAFRRSGLWEPSSWPDISAMATAACILFDQTKPEGKTLADIERALDFSYTKNLY
mgnify:CR=1 FL=1